MVVFFLPNTLWFFSFESSSHLTGPCRKDQWFTRVKSDEGGKSSYKEECIYEGREGNLGDGDKGNLFVCPGGLSPSLSQKLIFFAVFMIDG